MIGRRPYQHPTTFRNISPTWFECHVNAFVPKLPLLTWTIN